jgi:hypothetical protein
MNNNNFDNNRKDARRQKFSHSKPSNKKYEITEEQKFVSRSKKQLKKKIEEIKSEELWEDWEETDDI